MPARLKLVAVSLLVALGVAPVAFAACDNYQCPEYAQTDLQNMIESMGRLSDQYTNVDNTVTFREKSHEIYLRDTLEQLRDPKHPAITAAALAPGGMIGDIENWPTYEEWIEQGRAIPVRFRRSTGALIRGNAWRPPLDRAGPFPAISITPGSVQAPEPAYWWAAELLAEAGYVVLTFDAQGQGRSETFGHEDDGSESTTMEGFPSQQAINFHDLTVEALEFLLSTPGDPSPYAFAGDAAAGYDVFNPFGSLIEYLPDGFANVGLAGHSFGASGVTFAQDPAHNTLNREHIRTIVAWDNLASEYTPTVPAMGQNGESFVEPSFHYSRPDPEEKKSAFNTWRAAGIDTMQIAPRAATHLEWSYIPELPLAASSWGQEIAAWYTLAWLDKYLLGHPTADARLLTNAFNLPANENCGGRDGCYSIYLKSAYSFHDAGGVLHACDDVAHIADPAPCPDTDA
ncbi:MAG: alpha/beta hydrolase family protein [Actinomycetota bacterium]